jgi:hypothetical protein
MNPKDIRVEIGNDGTCIAIYIDGSPLEMVGDLEVTRLSDVEFDADLQEWKVMFRNGVTLPGTYKSRIAAINAEIDYADAHLSEFGDWVAAQHPERVKVYVDPGMS